MDFLIANAYAQDAAQPGGLASFLPLLIIFAVFYFLLIRPQMKRAKEHKKMTESLAKNDEIVTNGGLAGRVTKVDESFVTLQIAEGVEVQIQRNAVGSLLPKGSLKF